MRHFVVNLLPSDVGERLRTRGEARRTGLLVSLLLMAIIGVSIHSWDHARRARAVRDASVTQRDTTIDVDAELARAESDRDSLNDFMKTYRRVALSIEMSDLLATIANLMPPKSTLTDLSIKFATRETTAIRGPAAPTAPAAPGAARPPPPPPPKRFLEVRVRGFALSINEVSAFERALAATPPLESVALSENRSLETPDGSFQEFVITAEVPLDRNYSGTRANGPLALERDAAAPSPLALERRATPSWPFSTARIAPREERSP